MNVAITKPNTRLVGKTLYTDTALVVDKHPKPSTSHYVLDVDSTYKPDGSSKDMTRNILFPSLSKFKDPTRESYFTIQSSRDVFVLRLAEMYLIAAEAKYKLGDAESSKTYLNSLRTKRAWAGKSTQMEISSADLSLDYILDERAREMAGEQIRWFDLKRTGKLVERVKIYNPDAGQYIQNYHVLRPIPKAQRELTPSLNQI